MMHVAFNLTELSGGHSGAELYRAEVEGQRYLLKILPGEFDQKRLERIREICKLYEDLGIRSLSLIKCGKVKTTNQSFCFYNYIDGDNYEVLGKDYSKEDNYNIGRQIGTWLENLKKATPPPKIAEHKEDIGALSEDIAGKYHQALTNPTMVRTMREYLDLELLSQLGDRLIKQSHMFTHYTPHLIHGDIKRSNTMLDNDAKLWLIDIESMKMSYDIMNFRHQMTWFLTADDPKKLDFLRGVFDGLYKNTRSIDFSQQLTYITILNFCEYAAHHCHEIDTIRSYCRRMQPVFPKLLANQIRI